MESLLLVFANSQVIIMVAVLIACQLRLELSAPLTTALTEEWLLAHRLAASASHYSS